MPTNYALNKSLIKSMESLINEIFDDMDYFDDARERIDYLEDMIQRLENNTNAPLSSFKALAESSDNSGAIDFLFFYKELIHTPAIDMTNISNLFGLFALDAILPEETTIAVYDQSEDELNRESIEIECDDWVIIRHAHSVATLMFYKAPSQVVMTQSNLSAYSVMVVLCDSVMSIVNEISITRLYQDMELETI